MKKICSIVVLLLTVVFLRDVLALEREPWFYEPWNMQVTGSIGGEFYTDFNNGYNPSDYSSNNLNVRVNLLVPFTSNMDCELEAEFDKTKKYDFSFESIALQFRRQLLNDIAGDPISVYFCGSFRVVPSRKLRDVSVPYHDVVNMEIGCALGKEFCKRLDWVYRVFLFSSLGEANRGHPWMRVEAVIDGNIFSNYTFGIFARGYFGLGGHTLVNIGNFNGYHNVSHRSIDLGFAYRYSFPTSGRLGLEYFYRVYAHTFPEHVNNVMFHYTVSW